MSGVLPRSYLAGYRVSNNATDAVNDIDIATGKCRDSTNSDDIALASTLTKRIDAAWVVGTNQGGLDTGTVNKTGFVTYHIFAIKRSDTSVVDVLFSLSAAAPTMPTNYNYKRRIASVIVSSAITAIMPFTQKGDEFLWKDAQYDVDTSLDNTAITVGMSAPSGIQTNVIFSVGTLHPTETVSLVVTSLDCNNVSGSSFWTIFSDFNGGWGMGQLRIRADTAGLIRIRGTAVTAVQKAQMVTWGYVDTRGKDD